MYILSDQCEVGELPLPILLHLTDVSKYISRAVYRCELIELPMNRAPMHPFAFESMERRGYHSVDWNELPPDGQSDRVAFFGVKAHCGPTDVSIMFVDSPFSPP